MHFSNLKNLISSKFKVHKKRFTIRSYSTRVEFDDKCDYWLTSFKRLCDNKMIFEEKKLDIPLKETPRFILSNSGLFIRLLELLKSSNEEVVKEVWKLVASIPSNEELENKLKKLSFNENPEKEKTLIEWENYLQIAGNYDSPLLVYSLNLLKTLLIGKDIEKSYKEKFLKKGGLTFMSSVFSKKNNAIKSKLNVKCLEFSMRIMSAYINEETYSILLSNSNSEEALWKDIFDILQWLIIQNNGKELDQESEFSLYWSCCNIHLNMARVKPKNAQELLKKEYIEIIKESKILGIIFIGLLKKKNEKIQRISYNFINEICTSLLNKPTEIPLQKELMKILLTNFLDIALEETTSCKIYFELMGKLIVSLFLISLG